VAGKDLIVPVAIGGGLLLLALGAKDKYFGDAGDQKIIERVGDTVAETAGTISRAAGETVTNIFLGAAEGLADPIVDIFKKGIDRSARDDQAFIADLSKNFLDDKPSSTVKIFNKSLANELGSTGVFLDMDKFNAAATQNSISREPNFTTLDGRDVYMPPPTSTKSSSKPSTISKKSSSSSFKLSTSGGSGWRSRSRIQRA